MSFEENETEQKREGVDALCSQFRENVAVTPPRAPRSDVRPPPRRPVLAARPAAAQAPWHGLPLEHVEAQHEAAQFQQRFGSMRLDDGHEERDEAGAVAAAVPGMDVDTDADGGSGGAGDEDEPDEAAIAAEREWHWEHGSELCFLVSRFHVDSKKESDGHMPYIS